MNFGRRQGETGVRTLGIVGGGAWGTALGCVGRRAGCEVVLWAREPEVVEEINRAHRNSVFLADIPLDPNLEASGDLADLGRCDAILLVAPAQHMRRVTQALAVVLERPTPLVICAKGIEAASGRLMSEVVAETCPGHPLAVLSGPTFASEVARGLPTAVTLACADGALGEDLVEALGLPEFRPYYSADVTGAQIGGAVKNVLAIACGLVDGLALGENARAALMTRGLAEMTRFALARGARRETLGGLSGLGDLILTCSSAQSRNFSLGRSIGEGRRASEVLDSRRSVAEGYYTAEVLARLARKDAIEMPITAAVAAILHEAAEVDAVVGALLGRAFKKEES